MTFKNIVDVKVDIKWVAVLVFTAGALYTTICNTTERVIKIQEKTDQHESRIVILETQYQDIKEIKKDVKELLKRK